MYYEALRSRAQNKPYPQQYSHNTHSAAKQVHPQAKKPDGKKRDELVISDGVLRLPRPKRTFKQKASDAVTGAFGSWAFIITLFTIMIIWMSLNIYLVGTNKWDPYPFILLNFVLSTLAAIQAPIILMSQNRQAERDRYKAERDYFVNRRAEKLIEAVHKDVKELKRVIR